MKSREAEKKTKKQNFMDFSSIQKIADFSTQGYRSCWSNTASCGQVVCVSEVYLNNGFF